MGEQLDLEQAFKEGEWEQLAEDFSGITGISRERLDDHLKGSRPECITLERELTGGDWLVYVNNEGRKVRSPIHSRVKPAATVPGLSMFAGRHNE